MKHFLRNIPKDHIRNELKNNYLKRNILKAEFSNKIISFSDKYIF